MMSIKETPIRALFERHRFAGAAHVTTTVESGIMADRLAMMAERSMQYVLMRQTRAVFDEVRDGLAAPYRNLTS